MKNLLNTALLMVLSLNIVIGQAKLTIANSYIVEHGGTNPGLGGTAIYITLANANPNAIVSTGDWVVSESEFNMLRWDIQTNTGTYVIPFGYNTTYALPVTLNIGTAGASPGWIDFSTWHTVADNWTGLPSLNGPPSDVKNMTPAYTSQGSPSASDDSYNVADRFWVIDATSYDGLPGINNINFSYISASGLSSEVSAPNIFIESSLLAQRFNPTIGINGTWGDWLGWGATDAITGPVGTVSSGPVAATNFFRSWTLSSSNSPLPIQISSFTSECDNGAALLQWTSETELNNDYYTIKKTTDNIHFETVGTVKGAGTSDFSRQYSLTDNSIYPGTSYYLLYQTDIDGKTTEVTTIPFLGCETNPVTIVNGFNTINYVEIDINSASNDNIDISLVNMLGQTIIHEDHSVSLGSNVFRLNNSVSPGIYLLNVRNDKVNYTKKMVIGVK